MKQFSREAGEKEEVRQSKGFVLALQCSEKTPTRYSTQAKSCRAHNGHGLPSSVGVAARRRMDDAGRVLDVVDSGEGGRRRRAKRERGGRRRRRAEFEGK